jgi:hypothetical protein
VSNVTNDSGKPESVALKAGSSLSPSSTALSKNTCAVKAASSSSNSSNKVVVVIVIVSSDSSSH